MGLSPPKSSSNRLFDHAIIFIYYGYNAMLIECNISGDEWVAIIWLMHPLLNSSLQKVFLVVAYQLQIGYESSIIGRVPLMFYYMRWQVFPT